MAAILHIINTMKYSPVLMNITIIPNVKYKGTEHEQFYKDYHHLINHTKWTNNLSNALYTWFGMVLLCLIMV